MNETLHPQHESLRMQPADLLARMKSGETVTIVDVRNPRPWQHSDIMLRGAIRIDPVELPLDTAWPHDQLLAFY